MSNEPAPSPSDPDAFDAWAREAADSWQKARIHAEVERYLADPSASADGRAVAAVWGAPVGLPPVSELEELVADPSLSPVLQARVRMELAQATVATDPGDAVPLVAESLLVTADEELDIVTRLELWLGGADVLSRAGSLADAMGVLNLAGQTVTDAAEAPSWSLPAIDAARVALAARAGQDRDQMARSAHRVASAARDLEPTPTSIDVVLKGAGVLLSIGGARPAEDHFEFVLGATDDIAEARGPRFQALLGLAEARSVLEGPEAAMEVQRQAISEVEPLGDTPMLAWAHRGLAAQLLAADRFAEAAESFLTASEVFDRSGSTVDSVAMRLEQAGALVQGDDPDGGAAAADAAAEAIDDLPEELRPPLELRLHQIYAQVESYRGDLDAAAEHWLEVADRATLIGASPLEAQLNAAQLYAAAGDIDEATAQFGRAELAAADTEDPARSSALVMRTHAETLRQIGRPEDAAELARIAANHARTSGDEAQAVYLSVIAADSSHAAGDSAAAMQIYAEAIDAAKEAGMGSLQGAVHAAKAKVLHDMGRADEAAAEEALAAELGIAPAQAES